MRSIKPSVSDTHGDSRGPAASERFSAPACAERLIRAGMPHGLGGDLDAVPLDAWVAAADDARIDELVRALVAAREVGVPKRVRAVWMAVLCCREGATFEALFDFVLRDLADIRAFVRVVRSGVTGRRSLCARSRRCMRRFLHQCPASLLACDAGADLAQVEPTVADLIRLTHPTPSGEGHEALARWPVVASEALAPRSTRGASRGS